MSLFFNQSESISRRVCWRKWKPCLFLHVLPTLESVGGRICQSDFWSVFFSISPPSIPSSCLEMRHSIQINFSINFWRGWDEKAGGKERKWKVLEEVGQNELVLYAQNHKWSNMGSSKYDSSWNHGVLLYHDRHWWGKKIRFFYLVSW